MQRTFAAELGKSGSWTRPRYIVITPGLCLLQEFVLKCKQGGNEFLALRGQFSWALLCITELLEYALTHVMQYLASNHPDNWVTDPSPLSLPFWWSWHITTEMAFSRGEVSNSGVFLASFLSYIPKSVFSLLFSQFVDLRLHFPVVFKQNLALLPVWLFKN